MKLTVFNPTKDVLKNLDGLQNIQTKRENWNSRGFCWTCQKDKFKKGGTIKGHHDGSPGFAVGAPTRFTCSDCLEVRAAKKALAAIALEDKT